MENLPYLERVKIQSEILLPLYRRLRDELGAERANALLRDAVREYAENLGRAVGAAGAGTSLDKLRGLLPVMTAGDALDVEMHTNDTHELRFDIRRCAYAEFFQGIGEAEFGAMLTCEIDPPMTAGIGADLTLERSQTRMRGASHCDFRWTLTRG